ncbi:MAG: hypothetical protein QOE33_3145 [Acidobacteriota bacterium]|nr:hypothetical protein [Acidobacteriota bacterium]
MSQIDDEAREARAARLRAKIDRITGHQPDVSGDATADDAGESGGGPDEPSRKGESGRTRAATGEQSGAVADESPRDFIQRKMREGGEGEKR